ncbi:hypothetical protein TVAG_098240 [Trichomonas vaginalis G3]|uniref:Initiator binding domain-containing protein n=1 Tax=Trichomonas vaginalis (strain ATCC PRA-98 / G3) TaxID=412133 RepID=A2ECA4_TRIV3|nr:transcription-initiator DNA-binding domain ibd family [Trichomonas vaginalis G3]EAY09688.1 hypothetical protein TVAG_098240 [Trichomonas vaginalis G3]KAI5533945.1 transcription-initiator DNA-binding domain ibd family [Trichomonas vaginalis G3]|eukprot:XP_001321911.1 hypothetical protein [Trichomonas vaginalis G3]
MNIIHWLHQIEMMSSMTDPLKTLKNSRKDCIYKMLQPMRANHRTHECVLHPAFWNKLTEEDKNEFNKLKAHFHQNISSSGKDRRVVTFANELMAVLKFLDRDLIHREERCILTGICFAGPFICVNTRQLKTFLGRCKSSINGSFQQMGYVALRTKAKARNCIISILKPLMNEPAILRQWTVRRASDHTEFCYLSSFSVSLLPEVTEDDLDTEPVANNKSAQHQMPLPPPIKKISQQQLVQSIIQEKPHVQIQEKPPEIMKSVSFSYSLERLNTLDDSEWEMHPIDEGGIPDSLELDISNFGKMTRSVSASLDISGDWLRREDDWTLIDL